MTIRLKNQLNRLYKHKPQLVAPIINMILIPAKVVVARIMEALSKTTLVPITIQVQITIGAEDVVVENEKAFIINQIWSVITAINAANECRSKGDNHDANCAQEDNNHIQDEDDHAVLMATTSNETPNNQTWYLDTGCTNHMCGQKELFADLDDSFRTKVKFGDGRFVPVTRKGRILITLKNGDHRYIYDVFYVPDMKSNMLSMGQLAEKGYVMHIVKNQFSIFDKKNVV